LELATSTRFNEALTVSSISAESITQPQGLAHEMKIAQTIYKLYCRMYSQCWISIVNRLLIHVPDVTVGNALTLRNIINFKWIKTETYNGGKYVNIV